MLYKVKVQGKGTAHNYPKVQLSYLLVLSYWQTKKHCTWEMMKSNMGIFNEESGEISFSVLSRCVLGDSMKSDFDHMNKMYSLLPVFRDIKNDVLADNAASTSLSWRHKVNPAGEEVQRAGLFFKGAIRQIVRGTFKSYDGSPKSFKSASEAGTRKVVSQMTEVFLNLPTIQTHVNSLLATIKLDLNSHFVFPFKDIWPEAKVSVEEDPNDLDVAEDCGSSDTDNDSDANDQNNSEQEEPDNKVADGSTDDDEKKDEDSCEEEKEPEVESRSWRSWGTIHRENTMNGERTRRTTEQFLPSKRKIQRK
jgi:hypothetical protein